MDSFTQKQAIESLINARVDQAIQKLRNELRNEIKTQVQSSSINPVSGQQGFFGENKKNSDSRLFRPFQFNYIIDAPDNGPKSAIAGEINLDSSILHVLGLQDKQLKWVRTQDC